MNKYLDPKFVTGILAMIAIALNKKYFWHLNEIELTASIGVTVNFILMQLAEDIQKLKNHELPSWNSTKLVTLFVACALIGFTQYIGIDLDTESVLWIAGVAGAVITGKGIKDIRAAKQKTKEKEATNDYAWDPTERIGMED